MATNDDINYVQYKPGRARKQGTNKDTTSSTAHIHFKRQDLVTAFAAAYQGHAFRDSKGNHFQVVVEYAPYQKVPPKKPRPDPLAGTIDEDADFKAFVEKLQEPDDDKVETLEQQQPLRAAAAKATKKITPLLEELRRKKEEAAQRKKQGHSKKGKEVPPQGKVVTGAQASRKTADTAQPASSLTAPSKPSRTARKAATQVPAAEAVPESRTTAAVASMANKAQEDSAKKINKKGKKPEKAVRTSKSSAHPVTTTAAPPQIGSATTVTPSSPAPAAAGENKVPSKAAKQPMKIVPRPNGAAPKITILNPPKPSKEETPTPKPGPDAPATSPAPAPTKQSSQASAPVSKSKPILAGFEDMFEQFAKSTPSKPAANGQEKPAPATVSSGSTVKTAARVKGERKHVPQAASPAAGPEKPSTTSPKAAPAPVAEMAALTVQDKADKADSSRTGNSRGRGRGGHQPARGRGAGANRGRGVSKDATSPLQAPS